MKKKLETKFSTRQYMISKEFEIYYYVDNKLTPVAPHVHDYYEFYFFLEGDIEIHIADKDYPVKPGDIILVPPGVSHCPIFLEQNKPYRRFVFWISKEYCEHLTQISLDYIYLMQYAVTTKNYIFHNDTITFNAIQSMLFRLIEECRNNRFGKEAEISLQVNALMLSLNRMIYERNHPEIKPSEKKIYMRICDYITENLSEDLSLDRLALKFFVSKFYISHAFKDNMGISIHQYIKKKRLDAAKNAILSDVPISKVYELYGFNDYSSFYRSFVKEYGVSPKEYHYNATMYSV